MMYFFLFFCFQLSPKKTWEGFIGGFLATVIFGQAVRFLFRTCSLLSILFILAISYYVGALIYLAYYGSFLSFIFLPFDFIYNFFFIGLPSDDSVQIFLLSATGIFIFHLFILYTQTRFFFHMVGMIHTGEALDRFLDRHFRLQC